MNEKVKNFIDNIGVLCETWLIAYNSFVQRGLDHKTALEHTKAFMEALNTFNKP